MKTLGINKQSEERDTNTSSICIKDQFLFCIQWKCSTKNTTSVWINETVNVNMWVFYDCRCMLVCEYLQILSFVVSFGWHLIFLFLFFSFSNSFRYFPFFAHFCWRFSFPFASPYKTYGWVFGVLFCNVAVITFFNWKFRKCWKATKVPTKDR